MQDELGKALVGGCLCLHHWRLQVRAPVKQAVVLPAKQS